tara:strand:+ start:168 stop:602 length:435 start_codon:yes stop_codon:yes gene_type:complete
MNRLFENWRHFIKEGEEMDKHEVSKVMIIDDDKVLLLLRERSSHWLPLHWDFPGGHLKDDETWEEGAIREVKEETDLDVSDLQEISFENQEKRIKFFKTTSFSGKIVLDTVENEDYMWLKSSDLSNYDKLTPNVKRLIKQEILK